MHIIISIDSFEIAETFVDATAGTKELGVELRNFANCAAIRVAFLFAMGDASRANDRSIVRKTVYVYCGSGHPIYFPAQIDFSALGNRIDSLDKFRSEIAQSLRETFAYAIVYSQDDLEG